MAALKVTSSYGSSSTQPLASKEAKSQDFDTIQQPLIMAFNIFKVRLSSPLITCVVVGLT